MSLGDQRAVLRAMAHPVRLRILSLLTGNALTAADVARELALTHANASYHLRSLLSAGMIKLAGEERIRGGVAKRYRYDADRHRPPAGPVTITQTSAEFNRAMIAAFVAELERRSLLGDWTEPKSSTDAELWVDPEVWASVRERISQASRDLHDAARAARTPGTVRTSTTVVMFRMDES